jgi:hypothetical protein
VSINNNTRHSIYILIHIIRFKFLTAMEVNIFNRDSGFELKSLTHFNSEEYWEDYPFRQVWIGELRTVDLKPSLSVFEGVLTCSLVRKYVEPNGRTKYKWILLFLIWKSEGYRDLRAFVRLIECKKGYYWNEVKLREYYQRYANQLNAYMVGI